MRLGRATVSGAVRLLAQDPAGQARLLPLELGLNPLELLVSRPPLDSRWPVVADPSFLPPIGSPGKIIAVGLNYRDHAAETGMLAPTTPLTFSLYPSSLVGSGADVVVPDHLTDEVDYEVELAAIIGPASGGRTGNPPGQADILAYSIANDVSARDVQFADGQWSRAKSFDTFTPIGPWLVTPDEIRDPQQLALWTRVNGELLQDDSTASMIFSLDQLMRFVGDAVTLDPGDILLTGTPSGAGAFRQPPRYLQHGDRVEMGIEGIGELTNRVVYASRKGEL